MNRVLNKEALWFNIWVEGQGSLRQSIKYKQYIFSEKKKQWEAKVKKKRKKETDSTWNHNWFFPVRAIPIKLSCYHCGVDSVVYSLKSREWYHRKTVTSKRNCMSVLMNSENRPESNHEG